MGKFKPFVSRRWKKRLAYSHEKVRNVCCIIYLEDLERSGHTYYDLLGYLASLHLECACSCVHEHDLWTATDVLDWCDQRIDPLTGDVCLEDMGMHKEGEGDEAYVVLDDEEKLKTVPFVGKPKKAHVHVLLKGPSQQNSKWWTDLFAGLMPMRETIWEKCLSVPGNMRYFGHLDDPDKYQYGIYGIQGFGGIDMSCLVRVDEIRKTEIHGEILAWLTSNPNMRYFNDLVDRYSSDVDYSMYIKASSAYWVAYLSARSYKLRDQKAKREKQKLLEKELDKA